MQVSFSASGSPAEVREAINQQAKAAGRSNAAAWPAAAAVRDYVAQQLTGLDEGRTVTVSASVSVTLTGAERAEPAGKVTSVATGTVGVPGKAVAIGDLVVATDPAIAGAEITGDGSGVALPPLTGAEPHVMGVSEPATGRRASDRPSK